MTSPLDRLRAQPEVTSRHRLLPGSALFAALILLPLLAGAAGLYLGDMILALALACYTYSVQLQWRYLGIMNISVGGIAGVGAYVTGLLWVKTGLPFALALLAALLGGAVLGAAVGFAALRVQGHYFLLVGFGVAELLRILTSNLRDLTGGSGGLVLDGEAHLIVPLRPGDVGLYLALAVICAASAAAIIGLRRTAYGTRLIAMRDSHRMATALGMRTRRDRVGLFALATLPATAGGALVGVHQVTLTPNMFGGMLGLLAVVTMLIGGSSTVFGPLLGAAIVMLLPRYAGLDPVANQILYAIVLVVVILLAPQGLGGAVGRAAATMQGWLGRHRATPPRSDEET